MNISGARAIVVTLQHLGVSRVFGIPGIQTIELFDALADASFDTVVTTDERAAAFMADAHSRVTGELGVVIVVPGPGLTNALTGLAEAFCDSSPVLALVPGPDGTLHRAFRLHDIDQTAMMRPVVKDVFTAETLGTISTTLVMAARAALAGDPGPVAVVVPQQLFHEVGTIDLPTHLPPTQISEPDSEILDQMAAELSCTSVAIYAGKGAIGAADALRRLAELLHAPVATTISGRGVLAEDHPLSVGFGFGPAGSAAAWRALRRAKLLLSIGCKFSEPATGSFGGRVPKRHFHIDINSKSIGQNVRTDLRLVADANAAIEGLIQRIKPLSVQPKPTTIIRRRPAQESESADSVTPSHLLQTLRALLRRDAIITTDSGSHQFWALEAFSVYEPNTFLAPADFQAMGFSIPAGIAAKLAHPDRQVVSIVGDGGFLLSAAELATAQRLGVNLTVLIFRDGALGLIREAQKQVHRRTPFTEVADVDLAMLARSFGLDYLRIENDQQLQQGISAALSPERAIVIDAAVRYSAPSRYFRGAAAATFAHLPWDRKARLALRRAWRELRRSS